MSKNVGTVSRGIKAPIIRQGDDLSEIVVQSVLDAAKNDKFEINDKDVISITESIVARSQGNYCTTDDIAADVKAKLGSENIGVVFPIMSRNRFSLILSGFAKAAKHITIQLSYPSDEVGNKLISNEALLESGADPYKDSFTLEEFKKLFPDTRHEFTGVDYPAFYKELVEKNGAKCDIIFSNNAAKILDYASEVIVSDIHTRAFTKNIIKKAGAKKVLTLDEIMTDKKPGAGFNEKYGLLGSNKATEESLKLFPNECKPLCEKIQQKMKALTGKNIEVMVYGDGAFKDPAGGIWELADPVVSPGFTDGLNGTPSEIKLKYVADNDYADLSGEELSLKIKERIRQKDQNLVGKMVSEGTTPRRLTDLIGSLSDLTSGSGDKGTPIVLVQGYFDNYGK